MESCVHYRRREQQAGYTRFGTNRQVNEFVLFVYCVPEVEEGCNLCGGISYTYEWDFEDQTNPDCVQDGMSASIHHRTALDLGGMAAAEVQHQIGPHLGERQGVVAIAAVDGVVAPQNVDRVIAGGGS
jgi:hypothetical protein